jgi:hypothetical protein
MESQQKARASGFLLINGGLMSRPQEETSLTLDAADAAGAADGRPTPLKSGNQAAGLWVVALDPQSADAWESVQRLTALQPDQPCFAISVPAGREASTGLTHLVDAPGAEPFDLPTLIQTVTQLLSQLPERGRRNLGPACCESVENTAPCEASSSHVS